MVSSPHDTAIAWTFFYVIPPLFGGSLETLRLFQPDLALVMNATAATGAMWAAFRLAVAYRGKSSSA